MDSFLESIDNNPDSAIVWLLEPMRGSSIERWSGTLKHPNHDNKVGQTMDAFMHFSYVYSQHTIVFADIQGDFFVLNFFADANSYEQARRDDPTLRQGGYYLT